MCDSEEDKVALAGRIRIYLQAHRDAGDTIEGILAWWLVRQRFEESAERIHAAVAYLQEKGEVVSRVRADGRVGYALPEAGDRPG